MPEISFYKSKRDIDSSSSSSVEKVEDRLYIIKDGNKKGKIYYDYDGNTRIEIGSNDNILYYENGSMNDDTIIAQKSDFYILNENGSKSRITTPYDKLEVNKIVGTPFSIYVIKEIGPLNGLTDEQVRLVKLYEPQKLKWNDYFSGIAIVND